MTIKCKYCGKKSVFFNSRKAKFCNRKCYSQWKLGKNNSNWKGGKYISNYGYYYVRAPHNHPRKSSNGYIFEHRLLMEKKIGRYLEPNEYVHHINGDRVDNRIENLVILTKAQHNTEHFKGKPSHKRGKPRNPSTYKRDPNTGRYI